MEKNKKKSIIKDICFYTVLCGASLLLFTKILMIAHVNGSSMNNTYKDGDTVLVSRISSVDTGDVIICEVSENTDFIKRIIAKGGDTIDIDFEKGEVMINGNIIDEPYIREKTTLNKGTEFPMTVPENCYFVMGDNRNHSSDSRDKKIGCIDKDKIKGKVLFRLPL